MRATHLTLDLNGPFHLAYETGEEVRLSSATGRAIVAVLATSPKSKRSRTWFYDAMWPRSDVKQASDSFRNTLSFLRGKLNRSGTEHIKADRTYVWLDKVSLVPISDDPSVPIFEGPPKNTGEEFEDWLRDLRLHGAKTRANPPVPAKGDKFTRPVIAMNVPEIRSDDAFADIVAATLCDNIVSALRVQDVAAVLDLRDLASNQMETHGFSAQAPTALVTVKVITSGAFARYSISVTRPHTGQVMWNSSIGTDQESSFQLNGEQLIEFACLAIDSILNAVMRHTAKAALEPTLIASVHQIMNMSLAGQHTARRILKSDGVLSTSAVANAWYALSVANSIGERDNATSSDHLDEAEAHCAYALEMDPSNPLVLALTAHVYGFVFHQLERAGNLAERARSQGTFLPLVWDLSAMNALYRNDVKSALAFSNRAARYSRFSPYRHLFLSSRAISSALSGNHEQAVRVGRQVLAHMPGFLAVQRHLAGSHAALGQLQEARTMIRDVQARDASFNPKDIRAGQAALPSENSRKLVGMAFEKVGLTH